MKKKELDEKIVALREQGNTYKGIQLALGNPSKKYIRAVLLENAPNLVGDVLTNRGGLTKK